MPSNFLVQPFQHQILTKSGRNYLIMKNNCPKVYSVYNHNSLDQLDYLESRFKTLNIPFHFKEIELEDDLNL